MAVTQNSNIKQYPSVSIGKGGVVNAFKGQNDNISEGVFLDASRLSNDNNPVKRYWDMSSGIGNNVSINV